MNKEKTQNTSVIPKELSIKLLITLGILILVRLGTFIPVPDIDQEYLSNFLKNSSIAGFLNTFSINYPLEMKILEIWLPYV